MRPHRLTVEALGPYATETEIDFDALTEDGIFLIHGPTGAGKTFLFDAMAYALYASLGGVRHDTTLRSDFAERRVVPRVVFEFSVGDTRWKVERSPADDRRVISGSIKSPKAPKALLWRLDGDGWRPIAQKPTEVTDELTHLIGLGAKQFHQVIVLPQGKFEQVLRAKSSDRETLLRNLFDTTLFERVVGQLDHRAKATAQALAQARRDQSNLAQQAAQRWTNLTGWPSPANDPADKGGLGDGPLQQGGPVVDPDLCDELGAALHAEAKRQAERRDVLAQELTDHQTELLALDEAATNWDRQAQLRKNLNFLLAQSDQIDAVRQQLAMSEAAEALRPDLEALARARAQSEDSQNNAGRAIQLLTQTLAEPASALSDRPPIPSPSPLPTGTAPSASFDTTELKRWTDASIEEANTKLSELDGISQLASNAEAARAEATAAATTVERLADELTQTTTRRAKVQAQIEPLRARLADCVAAVSALAPASDEADRAEAAARASATLTGKRQTLTDLEIRLADAEAIRERSREEAQQLRDRHLDGIAATLAGELTDGDPCMVCGGVDHPAPNLAETGSIVSRPQVDSAEARVTAAEHDVAVAAKLASEHRAEYEQLLTAAEAQDAEVAATKAMAARHTANELLAVANQQGAISQQLKAAEDELETITARITTITSETATAKERARYLSQRSGELEVEVAGKLHEGQNPESSRTHCEAVLGRLRSLAELLRSIDRAQDLTRELEAALAVRLTKAELTSEAEVAKKLTDKSQQRAWAKKIEAHDRNLAACEAALAEPKMSELAEIRPDPEPQRTRVTQLSQERDRVVGAAATLQQGATEFDRVATDYRACAAETISIERTAEVINHLADRCSGRVEPKVSLPRWVLASYLAEICEHANTRLDAMTSGRYQLRVEPMKAKGNNKAGLELLILDAHTGIERPVNTLSGGETFQASLALALGVADVVEAHSGGVQIDALFIDEGFGTLDGEALELAMVELDRLREGGRVVGVISHVAGLRDRIRTSLEVIPGPTGSRVRIGEDALV